MTSKTIANGILRAVGILVLIAVMLYFLYEIQSVIAYILIAAVISLLGKPVVDFLHERLKFKNLLAVIVTMVLFLGIFTGIIGLLIPLLLEQGQNLSLLDINE
ncbi:MAG: AI-2E family transporter, partial [Bacteroidota bacterium]